MCEGDFGRQWPPKVPFVVPDPRKQNPARNAGVFGRSSRPLKINTRNGVLLFVRATRRIEAEPRTSVHFCCAERSFIGPVSCITAEHIPSTKMGAPPGELGLAGTHR